MKVLSKQEIRQYMEMAIEVMNQSIQEPREDKVSPSVGAILIKPDGTVETAFRGELREGDHAEFTLLERKNRSTLLNGSMLFATLEPCAPGARNHPKLGCAERIVNARIKEVWIGIEDPDPSVDRKGIKHLIDHGIEVHMFDSDLQDQIRQANAQFIKEAKERAKQVKDEYQQITLTKMEKVEVDSDFSDLSVNQLDSFISKAKLGVAEGTDKFNAVFRKLGIIEKVNDVFRPTGIGLLLFGNEPELSYPHALIKATYRSIGRNEEIKTFKGSLPRQIDQIQSWYEMHVGSQIDRSTAVRTEVYDYPLVVFREAIINAVVHRDYDIEGAPIYFEINDDAIIIKSPGKPVSPLTFEQIRRFDAPSLSRNRSGTTLSWDGTV